MKKNIITVALLAVFSTVAFSCQKENIDDSQMFMPQNEGSRTMLVTIDGISQTLTFRSDSDWLQFLERMTATARNGHTVRISNATAQYTNNATKEKIIYTTQIEADAISWSNKMIADGYTVEINFDDNTKTYTCIATR